jgi:hypothetical protein
MKTVHYKRERAIAAAVRETEVVCGRLGLLADKLAAAPSGSVEQCHVSVSIVCPYAPPGCPSSNCSGVLRRAPFQVLAVCGRVRSIVDLLLCLRPCLLAVAACVMLKKLDRYSTG